MRSAGWSCDRSAVESAVSIHTMAIPWQSKTERNFSHVNLLNLTEHYLMNRQGPYYAYWGLAKPPFAKVPDPEMYFDLHRTVEDAVSQTLFAIEEDHGCFVLIVGDTSLGKTMALRVIVDSLEQEHFRIAFVTKPDIGFRQLLKEIMRQLSGKLCAESRRERLLEAFRQLLLTA